MAQYYSSAEISSAAAQQQLSCKYTNLEQKTAQYHQVVSNEIVYGYYLADMSQIQNQTVPFSLDRVRQQLGRYGQRPQCYWWDWLHQNFPLVHIVSVGNSIKGVTSVAQPKHTPLDIILANANGKDLVAAVYSQYDLDSEIHTTPVNLHSLNSYIRATQAQGSHNETVQRNLKTARMILSIAEQCNGQLPQVVSSSSFGRTYYRGVNLQNVHKTVRHAALGQCYSVDIDSSVFNWKYAMVPFQQELTYTRELVLDKNRVRRQLALALFANDSEYSIKTVKEILTAVSFGARAETACWFKNQHNQWTQGAISEIVRSKQLRTAFFNTEWMRCFMAEQQRMNQHIGSDLALAVKQGHVPSMYLEDLKSQRGRISKGKLISWAYQHSEQQIMHEILKWARAQPMLQIHDGVYFKTKPDMLSMQTVLRDHWPLATLSIEHVNNYHFENRVVNQQHRDSIAQEEIKANSVKRGGSATPRVAHEQLNPHQEPDWQQQMQQQHDQLAAEYTQDAGMPEFARQLLTHNQAVTQCSAKKKPSTL